MTLHTELMYVRFARNLFRANKANPERYKDEFEPIIPKLKSKILKDMFEEGLYETYDKYGLIITEPIANYFYAMFKKEYEDVLQIAKFGDFEFKALGVLKAARNERDWKKIKSEVLDIVKGVSSNLKEKLKKYINKDNK